MEQMIIRDLYRGILTVSLTEINIFFCFMPRNSSLAGLDRIAE